MPLHSRILYEGIHKGAFVSMCACTDMSCKAMSSTEEGAAVSGRPRWRRSSKERRAPCTYAMGFRRVPAMLCARTHGEGGA